MLAIAAIPGGDLAWLHLREIDYRRLSGAGMLAAAPVDQHPSLGALGIASAFRWRSGGASSRTGVSSGRLAPICNPGGMR